MGACLSRWQQDGFYFWGQRRGPRQLHPVSGECVGRRDRNRAPMSGACGCSETRHVVSFAGCFAVSMAVCVRCQEFPSDDWRVAAGLGWIWGWVLTAGLEPAGEFSGENGPAETGSVCKLFAGNGLRPFLRCGPILTRFWGCPYSAEMLRDCAGNSGLDSVLSCPVVPAYLSACPLLFSSRQCLRHASWLDRTDAVSGDDRCGRAVGCCARSGWECFV